jgi:alpha-tubulin suppressor-like RCC1 family protein
MGACADAECPQGFEKSGKICKRLDAGHAADEAGVVQAESDAGGFSDASAAQTDSGRDDSAPRLDAEATSTVDASATDASRTSGDAAATLDASDTDHDAANPDASLADGGTDAVVGCSAGYVLKGGSCEDVDECFEGTQQCHVTAACKNTAGSYDCTCPPGYSGGTNAGFACAPRIAVGNGFACALQSDGRVKCWGGNSHGELGDGTVLSHSTPAFVKGLDHVVAIAAHDSTSACALRDDGRVTCWGDNVSGQLGDGTTDSHSEPTLLPTLTSAVAISVRNTRACAVVRDGGLRCWGSVGSLGTGGVGTSLSPTPITGIPPMASADVGWGGSGCAVTRTGTVWCWGGNLTDVPAQVPNIADVAQVTTGTARCVLRNNGQIGCWGSDPSTALNMTFDKVVSIACGLEYGYAVQQDGSVHAWLGAPSYQGQGANNYLIEPIDAVAVASGGAGTPSACAVVRDGTVRCWGINANGLGDGMTTGTDQTTSVWKVIKVSGLTLW